MQTHTRHLALVAVFALEWSAALSFAADIQVDLIPSNLGPYTGGESITVDVWLHSNLPPEWGGPGLAGIQFDFSQTSPNLSLAPTLFFDYSSIPGDIGNYERHPELPVPWTWNSVLCICPQLFFPFPPGGALHIASVDVQLPTTPGVFRLDALNAANENREFRVSGAIIIPHLCCGMLTAFEGEIAGGSFDFVVSPPPIPTVSAPALLALAVLLGCAGWWIIARKSRLEANEFALHKRGNAQSQSSLVKLSTVGGSINALLAIGGLLLLGISSTVLGQPSHPSRPSADLLIQPY